MAKVNLKLGKAIVRVPGEKIDVQIEGIEISAEYNAEELTVIKNLFESALGVTKENGIEIEFVESQTKLNNIFKDFMGTVMNVFSKQTEVLEGHSNLHDKHNVVSEKLTDVIGKFFGASKKVEDKPEDEEVTETRKMRTEYIKSGW